MAQQLFLQRLDFLSDDLKRLDLDLGGGKVNYRGASVLDIGCGKGYHLLNLLSAGCKKLIGGDISPLNFPQILATNPGPDLGLAVFEAGGLPFRDAVFDMVLCNLVLAYVADDGEVLQEIARVLKPGGKLLLRVVSLGYPLKKIIRGGVRVKGSGLMSILSTLLYQVTGVKIKRDTFHLPGQLIRLLNTVNIRTEDIILRYRYRIVPSGFNIIGMKLPGKG